MVAGLRPGGLWVEWCPTEVGWAVALGPGADVGVKVWVRPISGGQALGGGRDKTPKAPPFACGPEMILLLGKQGVWV